jgi:dihydroflavonol-4-reductase
LDHGVAGERYILGGHNVTYLELWTEMAKLVGRRPPIGKLPTWIAKIAGGVGDLAGRFTTAEPQLNSAVTAMGQIHHWYSSAKAIDQLGYQINDFLPALEESWKWFKERDYA